MKPATIAALEKTIEGLLQFIADPKHKATDEAIRGLVQLRKALDDEKEDEGEEYESPKHFGPD